MLKLNINEERQLTFEVQIGGIQTDKISSYLRLEIDNVEYGFPAVVTSENITVTIPPLRKVMNKPFKEGEEVDVRLDVFADGNYLTPWSDTFKLLNPLFVEAKILNNNFVKVKQLNEEDKSQEIENIEKEIEKKSEEVKTENKVSTEEELISKISDKLEEKFSNMFSKILGEKKKKNITEEVKQPTSIKKQKDKKIINENKKINNNKEELIDKYKNKITEDHVFKYMEKAGTRNKTVQQVIYEQASAISKDGSPAEILKQVVKIMTKYKK